MPVTRPTLHSVLASLTGKRKRYPVFAATVAALMFAAGCSDEAPVSPLYSALDETRSDAQSNDSDLEVGGSGATFKDPFEVDDDLGKPDDSSSSTDPSNPSDPELAEVAEGYVPDIEHGPTTSTPIGTTEKDISNALGGQIVHGKVRLDVPPSALDLATTTRYKVEIPAGNEFRINLYPHRSQFREPVTLTIDLSDAVNVGENVTLYWYDEDSNQWKNVGGTYDPVTKVLVAKLSHFSTYAPGRAGWNTDPGKPKLVEKN
jgi:hypothetical protein